MPQEISIEKIPIGASLPWTLFSPIGDRLLERGLTFTERRRDAFRAAEVLAVSIPEEGESDGQCWALLRGVEKPIEAINDDDALDGTITDSNSKLLLQDGERLTASSRQTLVRRGFTTVIVKRSCDPELRRRIAKLKALLFKLLPVAAPPALGEVVRAIPLKTARLCKGQLRRSGNDEPDFGNDEIIREVARSDAARALIEPPRIDEPESPEERTRLGAARTRLIHGLAQLFKALDEGRPVSGDDVADLARDLLANVVSERCHRLHLVGEGDNEADRYLAAHSLATAVISANIAARMDFAMDEILELAMAALLHDVGMIRVAAGIREKTGELSPMERTKVRAHPGFGLDLLEAVKRLPVSVPIVVYQDNERLDGSGYPRGIRARSLHIFSRIVAIAASYDAMTRDRPWRAGKHPHIVVGDLLQGVRTNKYDGNIMRAFLESFGLFPVSCGVQLSDGRMGTVLDAGGPAYSRPVVMAETDDEARPLRDTVVIDLQKKEYETTRVVKAVQKPFTTSTL